MKTLTTILLIVFLTFPAAAQLAPKKVLLNAEQLAAFELMGGGDLTHFEKVMSMDVHFHKVIYVLNLTEDEQHIVWRANYALYYPYAPSYQQDFFIRINNAKDPQAMQQEARGLFWNIRPFTTHGHSTSMGSRCGGSVAEMDPFDCICSAGSQFNWSCTNECHRVGSLCNETEDGCGFLYGSKCTGMCSTIPTGDRRRR